MNTNHTQDDDGEDNKTQKRLCDFCNESTAILYCKPDSAKLCLACDNEVHSTNQLFTKHTRSQLCDVCDSSPASIFCSTETLVLCQNCDWEKHNQFVSNVHDRRPLEGFNGCPNVSELCSIVGFEDVCKKDLCFVGEDGVDEFEDFFVWKSPVIGCVDDLIGSGNDDVHGFQAMGVPPLPKNRNAACGRHKGEILRQLRKMANLEPDLNYDLGDIKPLVSKLDWDSSDMCTGRKHDAGPFVFPAYEASAFHWCNDSAEGTNQIALSTLLGRHNEETCLVPEKISDTGEKSDHVIHTLEGQSEHPLISVTEPLYPKDPLYEFNSQIRDNALLRYKEKKKTRRYDRHIRYESRKVRAESRTRIKGRFAKIDR